MDSKIQDHHRQRPAAIYIRQSTMGQVRNHKESTERQYALKDKVLDLGWNPSDIKILDRDLGTSGSQTKDRVDFKSLVADVSLGKLGAVVSIEVSRLARQDLEWHRLIELCAVTHTLVIDEDGCYDPADFNDSLLLGIKGTIARAELHFIRMRLQGGKLNKAKKGELRFLLPVGFCFGDEDCIVFDPDQEVQNSIKLLFSKFRELGSAYAVSRWFTREGLSFPKRSYGGVWNGKIIWGNLSNSRVLSILKNPSYSGYYVFGRHHQEKEVSPDGEVRSRTKVAPMDSWRVRIPDHHEGYISWSEYLENQEILARNRTNGEGTVLQGPAREGLALLQGVLLCSGCGRNVTVSYRGHGGLYPVYRCDWKRKEGLSTTGCITVKCDLIDSAVSKRVLKAIEPKQIEIALEALRQLEEDQEVISKQWRLRLERAEYEAQLAERRYERVDPDYRAVAATLESRWNDALCNLEEVRRQHAEFRTRQNQSMTPELKAKVRELAEDFPRIWNAPTTAAKDRKRMLRLLIKDITVEREAISRRIVLHIRWQGGACEDLTVEPPLSIGDRLRYPESFVEKVRNLARKHDNEQIAEALNKEGILSAKKKAFTPSMIKWIRKKHNIPRPQLRKPHELTVMKVAEKYQVSLNVVYYWIKRGVIETRRLKKGNPYWITIDEEKDRELLAWVKNSIRIQNQRGRQDPQSTLE